MNKQSADLIVEGDHIVTMNDSDEVIEDGAVAVSHGLVAGVGTREQIHSKFRSDTVIEGTHRAVLPGLINGHTHSAMSLMRGMADDLDLQDWLETCIFPIERESVDREFVRVGSELAMAEMIQGGVTTFVDMYYYPDEMATVAESAGLRALLCAPIIDQVAPGILSGTDSLEKARIFVETYSGKSERIHPCLGPHAIYSLTEEQIKAVVKLSSDFDVPIHIHVAESQFETEWVKETYGSTPITQLDRLGVFGGQSMAAHVVWPTESEIDLLVQRNVGIIHNPTSNMKIAAGIAPVAAMLEAKACVGLGTDGAASNNDLDLWEEMRLAALTQKVTTEDPKVLAAPEVLSMATRLGARAVGLEEHIGQVRKGLKADLIQVELNRPHNVPLYNIVSHLVYVTHPQDVVSVIVDGRTLMRDRQLLTMDLDAILDRAHFISDSLRN